MIFSLAFEEVLFLDLLVFWIVFRAIIFFISLSHFIFVMQFPSTCKLEMHYFYLLLDVSPILCKTLYKTVQMYFFYIKSIREFLCYLYYVFFQFLGRWSCHRKHLRCRVLAIWITQNIANLFLQELTPFYKVGHVHFVDSVIL